MISFIQKNNNKNLILFIHGLSGSNDTWKNEVTQNTFPNLLLKDSEIKNNFDIAYFEYYTSLINAKEKFSILKTLFSKDKSTPKNLSVSEIADVLKTRINHQLDEYSSIVIIAHSMGGIIAKSVILDYAEEGSSRIKLFFSLAVPHLGSILANYGSFISSNIQIEHLKPFQQESMNLLERWYKSSVLPITKYFAGVYEGTVHINSAIPPNTNKKDIVKVDENHRTISKPKDENDIVVLSILKFLKEFLKNTKVDDIDYEKIISDEYNDEYFVLKLIITGIHSHFIEDSKKHFYYSEEIRKIFTSSSNRKILQELYAKIESIYKNLYGDLLTQKISSSNELVNEIHKKITEEDRELLQTSLSKINFLHKKGMIHQLANDLERDIFWDENKYSKNELDTKKGKDNA
ncbi:ABC-three component system protein [Aliarcobacter butzleri]|uniref:ABC-three component system protein n=1 Tax=Aliarcobacter butzleri TaxID=28197 RepID=UPI003AF4592C